MKLKEYKRDIKNCNSLNALFFRCAERVHSFSFVHAKIIKFVQDKAKRRLPESTLISNTSAIMQGGGFYNLAPIAGGVIVRSGI